MKFVCPKNTQITYLPRDDLDIWLKYHIFFQILHKTDMTSAIFAPNYFKEPLNLVLPVPRRGIAMDLTFASSAVFMMI